MLIENVLNIEYKSTTTIEKPVVDNKPTSNWAGLINS